MQNFNFENFEIWFVTGAQLLYGGDAVKHVDAHSNEMVAGLNKSGNLPIKVVYKGTVNSSAEVTATLSAANAAAGCAGVITWMHTFSPAKMWIHGLKDYRKPLLHLHTQFNKEIPWSEIDMDFMNLNQSAHGDREFGHIVSRMRKNRKVVAGHWQDPSVHERIAVWMRVAAAWADAQDMRIIRFGDNMNNVAVTDGDKVDAEIRLGYHVDYFPIGDLAAEVKLVSEKQVDELVAIYEKEYDFADSAKKGGKDHVQVREAARIEAALRKFLEEKGAKAFTTNFDALHEINQLPGLAAQRLMADGYGFGAEGDWKTAALVRTLKVMAHGLEGGTSFLEDYTYHFKGKGAILQAHMLEICPSIAGAKPRMEVHPLGIGGKADPARLVFTAHEGAGVAATVVDMGNRFRMIVNLVDVIKPEAALPKLPVASALWIPQPDLETGATAWIYAGGTHHTAFSFPLTREYMEDYAEIADIEMVTIDGSTTISEFKKELRFNEVYYMLNKALQ
ncbi:MAG: L-arabinose isomerase [Prevotellaceae bacterium]|jgi:L-arabinose isomerase|nr:L-arabinose isomerase [Prevotellaceae bacterium]